MTLLLFITTYVNSVTEILHDIRRDTTGENMSQWSVLRCWASFSPYHVKKCQHYTLWWCQLAALYFYLKLASITRAPVPSPFIETCGIVTKLSVYTFVHSKYGHFLCRNNQPQKLPANLQPKLERNCKIFKLQRPFQNQISPQ